MMNLRQDPQTRLAEIDRRIEEIEKELSRQTARLEELLLARDGYEEQAALISTLLASIEDAVQQRIQVVQEQNKVSSS